MASKHLPATHSKQCCEHHHKSSSNICKWQSHFQDLQDTCRFLGRNLIDLEGMEWYIPSCEGKILLTKNTTPRKAILPNSRNRALTTPRLTSQKTCQGTLRHKQNKVNSCDQSTWKSKNWPGEQTQRKQALSRWRWKPEKKKIFNINSTNSYLSVITLKVLNQKRDQGWYSGITS